MAFPIESVHRPYNSAAHRADCDGAIWTAYSNTQP